MPDASFSSANSRNVITVNNRLCGSGTAAKYQRVGEEDDSAHGRQVAASQAALLAVPDTNES